VLPLDSTPMAHDETAGTGRDEPTTDDDELSELVGRTGGVQPWRRAFHAASGIVMAVGPHLLDFERRTTVLLLAGLLLVALAIDLVRLRAPTLNTLFFRVFTRLASPREAEHLASSTWYLAGALLTWAVFPGPVATAAILVLALADPSASVIGRLVGRRPLGKGTVEGVLVFYAVASAVLWAAFGDPMALLVAAAVAAVEVLPIPLDDNLTVPLATAGLLVLVT